MTRSIFDPGGGRTHRSGTRFTPPEAAPIFQLAGSFDKPSSDVAEGDVDFVAPPAVPTVQIAKENDGKLLIVKLTGKLQKSDYLHLVPMVNEAVARDGKFRLLIELHHFHGWTAGTIWEDIKFDLKNFDRIERLAIVGETRWEHGMAAFC